MREKTLIILNVIFFIILSLLGVSFAYFGINIKDLETVTTILSKGGVMQVNYDGGEILNVPNIYPKEEPILEKNFSLTGNTTFNENIEYHIMLIFDENTLTNDAITYTLESINVNTNGNVAPSILNDKGIPEGPSEIFLGNAYFDGNSTNAVHNYKLKLYFKIKDDNNENQEKLFKAHIEVREDKWTATGYNKEKDVNHPILFTGMSPVIWDGEEFIETIESDPSWYDYENKIWANARSLDGSYWVWVPRYAYKIESCYHADSQKCLNETGKEAGDIDVLFLKGNTNRTKDNFIVETIYEYGTKDTSNHYFLHPAFKFKETSLGFWVAKYEPSNSNGNIKIRPNEISWRGLNISEMFNTTKEMKSKSSTYGWFPTEVDPHIMTNLEWGSVVYLSKSKYGAHNEKIWANVNNSYITGCAGNSKEESTPSDVCNSYDTPIGTKASTTHNIYGIYDLSGGADEYVMGNFNNLTMSSNLNNLTLIPNKYLTRYINQAYNKNMYGDAIYEVSSLSDNYWFNDFGSELSEDLPWMIRGGYRLNSLAGSFISYGASGGGSEYSSWRPVISPSFE